MDTRRILEQFTGHRGMGGGRGGIEDLLGGLLSGRGGAGGMLNGGGAAPNAGLGTQVGTGMGGLGGMLDALGGGMRGGPAPGAGMGGANSGGTGQRGPDGLGGLFGRGGPAGGLGGMLNTPMGSAAAGGILGSLLGGRSGSGNSGLIRVGGMAILAALAHRAFKNWQGQQPGQAAPSPAPSPEAHPEAPAADSQPFGLAVIRAMIAAAKADGSIDAQERERIFAEVDRLDLPDAEKGFVFGALREEADPRAIAGLARDDGQKAQLYLASRLVLNPDTAAERAWLDALAHELGLPAGLRQQLDQQAREASEAAASAQV